MTDSSKRLPNIGINLAPVQVGSVLEAAQRAERLGFESVWFGEHVVTPLESDDAAFPGRKLNFEAGSPMLDPLLTLAHIAAGTSTIRLGTGVLCAPLRDPLLTAREIVTLDRLSGGRLEIGLGLGWMREEFAAMGREWAHRGKWLEEFVAVLDGLFTGKPFSFDGDLVSFPPVVLGPSPVQTPRPPILLGGHGPKALARAAKLGDGWLGGSKPADEIAESVDTLIRHRKEMGLDESGFAISMIVLGTLSRTQLTELYERGVRRVIVTPWSRGAGDPPFPGEVDDLTPMDIFADEIGLAHR